MIREDSLGKQRLFFALNDDPWPGLGEEDVGTRLFITDRKVIRWWDGDQWVPGSSGWFTLFQANPFVSRLSANDATDDDFQELYAINIPPDLMTFMSAIRVWHWWWCTTSGNTKAVAAYLNAGTIAAPAGAAVVTFAQSNLMWINGALNNVVGVNNSLDVGATANNPLNPAAADFSKAMKLSWSCRWTTQPITPQETITLQRVAVELFN